jgi:hypothetical protein
MPHLDNRISPVSNKLEGVYPQDGLGNVYPENGHFVR